MTKRVRPQGAELNSRLLRRMSGALLASALPIAVMAAVPAFAQSSYLMADGTSTNDLSLAAASWVSDEFLRGRHLAPINAQYAYARGVTGRGIVTANIDTGVYFDHSEWAMPGKLTSIDIAGTRSVPDRNIGAQAGDPFVLRGNEPFGPFASHGSGAHGLTAAARDGAGMHGVAFASTAFIADGGLTGENSEMPVNFRDVNIFTPIYEQLTARGVRLISQSWGDGSVRDKAALYNRWMAAPDSSSFDAAAGAALAETSGKGRTIMVFAGGNFASSYSAPPPPGAFASLPYLRPELERSWITAVALNGNQSNLASYSVQCGLAKYWCIAAPADGTVSTSTDGNYQGFGGTSAATPIVSGALALVMERFPYLNNEEARVVLLTTGRPLDGQTSVSDRFGWGLVDLRKAMDGPGEFLGEFVADLPEGVSDVWANAISENALVQRSAENEVTAAAWQTRRADIEAQIDPTALADLAASARSQLELAAERIAAGDVVGADAALADNFVSGEVIGQFDSESGGLWRLKGLYVFFGLADTVSTRLRSFLAGLSDDIYEQASERLASGLRNELQIEDRRVASFADIPTRGSLVKSGAGALRLTGENTYTGGTTVSGGLLTIGDGATSGSILGDVRNDAVLAFDRSDAASFAGEMSGTGILVQTGTGTLTLSGTNAHTGGTLIQRGTLAAAGGSALPDVGTVQIAASGLLSLLADEAIGGLSGTGGVDLAASRLSVGADGSSSIFGGAIVGTGGLSKIGGGALLLTGDSTYSGATFLQSGLLSVDGSLASGVEVADRARLGGNGRIGGLDVRSGGVLAPGASVGTLTVAGDATFAPGSLYEVEVAPDGRMDRLVVGGQAFLGGVRIVVLKEDADRALDIGEFASLVGASAQIVTADGGLVSSAGPIAGTDFLFLAGLLDQGPNALRLTLQRNATAFAGLADTPNGRAAATAIDSIAPGIALYEAIVRTNDPAALPGLFSALSGEIHASVAGGLLDGSRFLRSQALRQASGTDEAAGSSVALAEGGGMTTTAYLSGVGAWADQEGANGTASLDRSTGGFLVGLGTTADGWSVGGVAGYTDTSFDLSGAAGSASVDSYHFGLYAGRSLDAWRLSAGAGYTRHEVSTGRSIAVPGLALQSLSADYSADMAQLFGEVGYQLGNERLGFEPFANLAYVHLSTGRFGEGSAAAALTSGGFSNDALFSTLGLNVSTLLEVGAVPVTARGSLGWRHAEGDMTQEAGLAFAAGGPGFTSVGTPIAKDALVVEAGFDAAITEALSFDVSYEGQFGDGTHSNGVRAGLTWKF